MIIEQATLNQITAARDVPPPRRSDEGDGQAFDQMLDKLSNSQPQQASAASSTTSADPTSRAAKAPKREGNRQVEDATISSDEADAGSTPQTPASDSTDETSDADQPAPVTADAGEDANSSEVATGDSPQPDQPVEPAQAGNVVVALPTEVIALQTIVHVDPQPAPARVTVAVNDEPAGHPQPQPTQAATTVTPTIKPVVTPSAGTQQAQAPVTQTAPVHPDQTAEAQPTKAPQPQVKVQSPQPQPVPRTDAPVKPEVVQVATPVKPAPSNTAPVQPAAAEPIKPQKPAVTSSAPAPVPTPTVEASEPAPRPQPAQPLNLQASSQQSISNSDDSQQQPTGREQHSQNTQNRAPVIPTVRINEPARVDVRIEPTVELPSNQPEAKQLAKQPVTEQSPTLPQHVTAQVAPAPVEINAASPDAPAPTTHNVELAPPAPASSGTHTPNVHSHSPVLSNAMADLSESDTSRLADQMSRGLQAAINQRGGTVTLRLAPPELGVLRIQVRLIHGAVQANFETATQTVGHLIQRHANSLRQALEAQGLTVDRIQVNVQPPNPGSGAQSQAQQDSGSTADGRSRGLLDHNNTKQDSNGGRSAQQDQPRRFQRELLDLVA